MENKIIPRMEIHAHSEKSNLRMLDCTNRPADLVKAAHDLGLAGIVLTDHECLSAHVEMDDLQDKWHEIDPNFKVIRGNEIYLTEDRRSGQMYYHFILIALDATGHRMLRELSTKAWINSYFDRGLERVPTLYSEVEEVVQKYGQGHLHASTACLGGRVNHFANELWKARRIGDKEGAKQAHQEIVDMINWCQKVFGKEHFTLEVAPGRSEDQLNTNRVMKSIGESLGIPICIGTDAHYLRPEDRIVHKALLNSRESEREVDEFYYYAYLQTQDEIIQNLQDTGLDYTELCGNSMKIYDKCQFYTLKRNQHVQEVEVPEFPKKENELTNYPILSSMYSSDEPQERYWVNTCVDKLEELDLKNDTYLSRLEEEADVQRVVGEKLGTCIFAYSNFLQHYIDLFWDTGSTVGVSRGSASGGLGHFLLGITQLDPIENKLPYFRFLNKDRIELPELNMSMLGSIKSVNPTKGCAA